MPFSIIQHDLITMRTDVIVNATDRFYSGGGGVDRAIHRAAGPELFEACGYLGRLRHGEVKATGGYNLPVKYIFHTSGPRWTGGSDRELLLLGNCYRNSITLAREKSCRSLAFPLISSKGKHFPKEVALTIAIDAIRESLAQSDDIEVYLVVYGEHMKTLSENLFPQVQQIIEENYRPSSTYVEDIVPSDSLIQEPELKARILCAIQEDISGKTESDTDYDTPTEVDIDRLIDDLLNHPTQKYLDRIPIDENFAQMLTRILKERGLKHAEVYDELGMSNVGFWKLLKGKSNPSKMTVFGLAVALKLSIEETREMLLKSGYAINPSSLQDVIIAGLIQKNIHDRYAMDELLYALDLQLLPGAIID